MIWWLSFADGELPEGQQFLGVAVIKADTFGLAVVKTHRLGINPGGEVLGFELPYTPDMTWLNRLLDKKEVEGMETENGFPGEALTLGELDD